jgi:hypothetical protein
MGMVVCPYGHDSASSDFCDVCGTRLGRRPFAPLVPHAEPFPPAPEASSSPPDPVSGFSPLSPSYSAGPPEALFPSLPRPEPPDSPWGWPETVPSSRRRPDSPSSSRTKPEPAEPPQDQVRPRHPDPSREPFSSREWFPAPEPLSPPDPFGSGGWSGGQPGVPDQPVPSDESDLSDLLASLFAPGPAARPQPPADRPEPVPAAWREPAPPVPLEPPTAPSLPAAAAEPPTLADLSAAAPGAFRPSFTPIATWTAQLGSDRAYYDRMRSVRGLQGGDIAFPDRTVERRIALTGKQLRIGRRSASADLNPEIDTADPGVSRLHAVLIAVQDGSWAVLDSGSANGTYLNGRRIAKGDLITLREGDLITLGAWTAIAIRRG